jgi:acyl carrier protein
VNAASAEQKLKEILARVIGEGGKARVNPSQLDAQADFATLGVNSVDLMEFVLRAENEFGIDILSEMLPDELPTSLNGWARLMSARLDRPAQSEG